MLLEQQQLIGSVHRMMLTILIHVLVGSHLEFLPLEVCGMDIQYTELVQIQCQTLQTGLIIQDLVDRPHGKCYLGIYNTGRGVSNGPLGLGFSSRQVPSQNHAGRNLI